MYNKLLKFAAPPPSPKHAPKATLPTPKPQAQNGVVRPAANRPATNKPAVVKSSAVSVMQNKLRDFATVVSNNPNENIIISSQLPTKDNLSSMAEYILSNNKVDGHWKETTNNSLAFGYKILYALVVSNNYFKLNVAEYNPQYLNNLKSLLDASKIDTKTNSVDLDEKTKSEYADYITSHLNQGILYYNEIIKKINENEKIDVNSANKYSKFLDLDTLLKSEDSAQFMDPVPSDEFNKPYKLGTSTVYINGSALGGYLQNVASNAKENSDKVLGSLVNKIITQTRNLTDNSVKPVSVSYQDEISDDKVLFNADLSDFGGTSAPLKIKDLLNRFNLNKWLSDNKIPNANKNNLLNYFKNKLEELDGSTSEEFLSKMYLHGQSLINNLLTEVKTNSKQPQETAQQSEISSTVVNAILRNLPLQNNIISKRTIDAFFIQLGKLGGMYDEYKNKIEQEFDKVNRLADGNVFTLNQGPDNIFAQLKTPTPNNFNLLITSLLTIINQVSFAVNEFKANRIAQINEADTSLKNNLNAQTGSSSSAYAYNLYYLKDLRDKLSRSIQLHKGVN